jgi:hypothetical protein
MSGVTPSHCRSMVDPGQGDPDHLPAWHSSFGRTEWFGSFVLIKH